MAEVHEGKTRAAILEKARKKVGTAYDKLDCSHFVHAAYEEAGLTFPYTATAHYASVLIDKYFVKIADTAAKPGDLILYSGHVGIYDPDGCSTTNTAECKRVATKAPSMRILSARSGKNLGVEYGQSSWFGTGTYLAWKAFGQAAAGTGADTRQR